MAHRAARKLQSVGIFVSNAVKLFPLSEPLIILILLRVLDFCGLCLVAVKIGSKHALYTGEHFTQIYREGPAFWFACPVAVRVVHSSYSQAKWTTHLWDKIGWTRARATWALD